MIGFGNEPNPVFALTFRQCCRKVSARRRHGGLGRAPASAFVIQMLCLRQRRHRRRWYLKGADNTPYEKIGDEVRSLADEVPFDIPDSWEWVRIRSLGEIVRGSGIKRNETVQQVSRASATVSSIQPIRHRSLQLFHLLPLISTRNVSIFRMAMCS